MGVMKTEQDGAYRAVQPNSEGKMPVVKVWDEASGKYVPVLSVTGGGVELPELTSPGTENNLEKNFQMIDENGNIVNGKAEVVKFVKLTITNLAAGSADVEYVGTGGYWTGASLYGITTREITVREKSMVAFVTSGIGFYSLSGSVSKVHSFSIGNSGQRAEVIVVYVGSDNGTQNNVYLQ